jgi:hypothetical protein
MAVILPFAISKDMVCGMPSGSIVEYWPGMNVAAPQDTTPDF